MAASAVSILELVFNASEATRYSEYIPSSEGEGQLEGIERQLAICAAAETARGRFCKKVYKDFQFVYRDPLGHAKPKEVSRDTHSCGAFLLVLPTLTCLQGLFHSPFILPILRTHLEQTSQALTPSALFNSRDPLRPVCPDRPVGAIALAASAVSPKHMAYRIDLIRSEHVGGTCHSPLEEQPHQDQRGRPDVLPEKAQSDYG